MNVQTPFKGIHTKKCVCFFTSINDEKMKFLENFGNWLDTWEKLPSKESQLTRETFTALNNMTHAITEITRCCISDVNFKYILTAKFQTNKLENRFGQYRQQKGTIMFPVGRYVNLKKKNRVMSVLERGLPMTRKLP